MIIIVNPRCRSEFRRVGIFNTPRLGTPVLDSFRIFTHFEQRNLASALRFFCGRTLCGAHGALADAQAAQDVLLAEVGAGGRQGLGHARLWCGTGHILPLICCTDAEA
jgi:hypothetical protein